MCKMVLWDTSEPFSRSTRSPNKVAIPCSNPLSLKLLSSLAASSMSLDSVTMLHGAETGGEGLN